MKPDQLRAGQARKGQAWPWPDQDMPDQIKQKEAAQGAERLPKR